MTSGRRATGLLFFAFWLGPALLVNPTGDVMSDALVTTATSIVDRGTLEVSPHSAFDLSLMNGRFYSGYEPGSSLLAAAVYALARGPISWMPDRLARSYRPRVAAARPHRVDPEVYFLHLCLVWLVMAPLSAAFAVLTVKWARLQGSTAAQALWIGAGAAYGSLQFTYACAYSRQALANLIIGCVLLLRWTSARPRGTAACWAEGLALGSAVACNYLSGPFAVAAGLMLLQGLGRRQAAGLAGGAAAAGLALAAFNHRVYGHPLATAYSHRFYLSHPVPLRYKGLSWFHDVGTTPAGIAGPSLATAVKLLVGPFRGAFVFCPALLPALWGHAAWLRDRARRSPALFCLSLFAGYLALNSCLYHEFMWSGTPYSFGPRYLLSGLTMAGLGLAAFKPRTAGWRAAVALLVPSIGIGLLGGMFQDTMTTGTMDAPVLQRPIAYFLADLLRSGPRVPLLEIYGAARWAQGAVFFAAAAAALMALRRAREAV